MFFNQFVELFCIFHISKDYLLSKNLFHIFTCVCVFHGKHLLTNQIPPQNNVVSSEKMFCSQKYCKMLIFQSCQPFQGLDNTFPSSSLITRESPFTLRYLRTKVSNTLLFLTNQTWFILKELHWWSCGRTARRNVITHN